MDVLNAKSALFHTNASVIKPYALMDLDDTLFQTQRKIEGWGLPTADKTNLQCATVDKKGEPLSFMTTRQQNLVNWLLLSTELIVVTARDTTEIKRVKLPFSSWQILTHGAVILQADGQALPDWQVKMATTLQPLQSKLKVLTNIVNQYNHSQGGLLKLTMHSDTFQLPDSINDNVCLDNRDTDNTDTDKTCTDTPSIDSKSLVLNIYLAIKHRQKNHQALVQFSQWLTLNHPSLADDFYIHCNANNLAILPHGIHKKFAVAFLLDNYLDNERPSFGFGDSLADLPFLQLLDWYGMPNHGQLHNKVSTDHQALN